MSHSVHEPRFDVASAVSPGQRNYQEDTLITDFPQGTDIGFAVLADGMGGHAAGDVASKIMALFAFRIDVHATPMAPARQWRGVGFW